MPLAELRDGPEVRPLPTGHRHEIDPLLAGLGDPPRGVKALAVGVKKHWRPSHFVRNGEGNAPNITETRS